MKNNLSMKNDKSLFGKIKNFFRKLFYKDKSVNNPNINIETQEQVKENLDKTKIQENIKDEKENDYINDSKREKFLDDLEKNPELLFKLSEENLAKLEEYCKYSIGKYEKKLEKMKKRVNN